MRILILGGTRFIGPFVVRELLAGGHTITLFHRGESEADLPTSIAHIHGERAKIGAVGRMFRRLAPDAVIDMSAYSETDAKGAIDAVRDGVGRYVVISSMDVYRTYGLFHGTESGPPEPMPVTEDAPMRTKLYPYRGERPGFDEYDKILVERAVMAASDLGPTVLRLPMVYGEGDYQRRLRIEIKRMDDRRPAIILDETLARWRSTYGHVENVAHAIVLAATDARAADRVYNVGEPDAPAYADWLRQIGEAAGWEGEVITLSRDRLPQQLLPPPGHYEHDLAADTSRVREEIGYEEPVPRADALRRSIEWERAERAKGGGKAYDYSAEDALLASLAR
jgi:nucleoside-diphosphate-sugar epimerase